MGRASRTWRYAIYQLASRTSTTLRTTPYRMGLLQSARADSGTGGFNRPDRTLNNDRIPQRIPASSNIRRLALQRTRILLSADFNRLAHSFSLPAAERGR